MRKLENLKNVADANLDGLDISEEAKLRLRNSKESSRYAVKLRRSRLTPLKLLGFIGTPVLAAALAFVVFFTGIFPGKGPLKVRASNLMKDIKANDITSAELNREFIYATADFSLELFKKSYNKDENSLISPTSVMLALGMTANGAEGNTLEEFESKLGGRILDMKSLNPDYKTLASDLTKVNSGKMNIANSIWFTSDNGLTVNKDFLQTNGDYYKASAYQSDFKSSSTAEDINKWVKYNTEGNIDKIIDKINPNTVMYLINAVYFEDEWERIYKKSDIEKGAFHLIDNSTKNIDFMYSYERYVEDSKVQGVIKPYKSGKYSFVALLPREENSIDSYISSLSGNSFINLLSDNAKVSAYAGLPKFKAEYDVDLVKPLKQMGLNLCFDPDKADFSKMGSSNTGNIFVGDILHKTFIVVDARGTKAGAVTKVEKATASAPGRPLLFNRPFLYAIVDNNTKLPVFIGTVMNP